MGKMEIKDENLFITFEGIEGSGKSTQAKMLYEHLLEGGYPVIATREPGATPIGRVIRDTLLSTKFPEMDERAELFLFAACRSQHVTETIMPALAANKIVICDRFVDSTLAYQAYGRGLDVVEVSRISDWAASGLLPHLTFLLDITVDTAFQRIERGDLDRIEQTDRDFHERVYQGYRDLAARNPDRIKVVDATRKVAAIHRVITETIDSLL
jgi:dTMP kinase